MGARLGVPGAVSCLGSGRRRFDLSLASVTYLKRKLMNECHYLMQM